MNTHVFTCSGLTYLTKLLIVKPFLSAVLSWRPDESKLDPVLKALPTYLTIDNFSTYVRHSAMALFLEPIAGTTNKALDLDYATRLTQTHDHYYRHGGVATFDENGKVLTISGSIPTEKSIRRFIASFWSTVTWEVHLGLNHLLIGDEWNYLFFKHVSQDHPVASLIKPVAFGVAAGANLAGLILLNDLDTCIAAALSNYTPQSLRTLTRRRVKHAKDFIHFPTMMQRICGDEGMEKCPPTMKALGLWWRVLEDFVSEYIDSTGTHELDDGLKAWLSELKIFDEPSIDDLKTAITMMYFNGVIHELFSNEQMNHDAFKNRVVFLCDRRDDNELPCAYVQERAVEVLVATSGASSQLWNTDYEHLAPNEACRKHWQQLKQSVQQLETKMSAASMFAHCLLPRNVETSLAW